MSDQTSSKLSALSSQIFRGGGFVTGLLAIVAAFIVGGILIAASNEEVAASAQYFLARPLDTLLAIWNAVFGAYDAMFRGAIFNYRAESLPAMIKPITETLTYATPITLAGLGMAISFRSGLFNIGAQGQIIFGAIFAAIVGVQLQLPPGLHLLVAMLGGLIGGAIWGGLVGLLKATTGANEVIVTIMFNYIASLFLFYLLTTPLLQAPGGLNPISPRMPETVLYPNLFGDPFRLNAAFLLMLIMVVVVWWLMNRTSIGFQFRALGHNPSASRVAGISIGRTYILVLAISGALAGLAGTSQVLGTEKVLSVGVAATFGFDAITVALLGRSNPWGVLAAGILFGALRAGAVIMQANQGVPIDIVLVVQSMIVLFIAAPPLVRSMFGLSGKRKQSKAKSAESTVAGDTK